MHLNISNRSTVGNIVVGKPTTYQSHIQYYQCDFPEQLHTHHFSWCKPQDKGRDYFLDKLVNNFKTLLNIEPICRVINIDLQETTDVYVCRSFKYDVYILVMDDVLTLTRHIPVFTQQDYEISEFDFDAFISHRVVICEAFTALSYSPVEFIMLAGINTNTKIIPMYMSECIDITKSIILGEEIGYKYGVGEDAYDEPDISFGKVLCSIFS